MTGALSELAVVLTLKDQMQAGISSATANLQKLKTGAAGAGTAADTMASKYTKAATGIAAAATAMSAGIVLVTGRAKEVNSQLDAMAASAGADKQAFRDMAGSLVDVTYSYDEIISTLQELESHGVTSVDSLKKLASAADTTADALQGSTASAAMAANVMETLGEAFNMPIEDVINLQDAIAYASNLGKTELSSLLTVTQRVGAGFSDIGGNAQDLIGIVSTMKLTQGLGDRKIIQEINSAIDAAAGAEQNWSDSMDKANTSQADLTEQIKDGQKSLSDLTDEINSSQQAIVDYNDKITKQQTTVDNLAQAYQDSLTSTDAYASAYEGVKDKADSLTESLESEQKQLLSLNESLAEAQLAHADLEKQYSDAVASVRSLTAEYEASKSATDLYATAQEKAAETLDTLGSQYDNMQGQLDDYRDKLSDLDTEEVKIQKNRDKTAASIVELTKEYQDAVSNTDILDTATKKHADSVASLTEEYEKLGDSVEKYQDDLIKNAHETGNLQTDLANEKANLASLSAEYENLNNAKNASGGKLYIDPTSMAALGTAITDSQGKIDEYTFKISENQKEQARLSESLSETQAAQAANATAQASAASDTTWYTDAVKAQDDAVQAIVDKLATAQQSYADLGDSLVDNRKSYANTTDKIIELKAEYQTLGEKVATAQDQLNEFNQISIDGTAALTPFQQAAKDSADRTADLATKLDSAQSKVSDLTKQLSENVDKQNDIKQSMSDTTSTIGDYQNQLSDVNSELQKFKDAGLDIINNSSAFEDAQKKTAENQERALKAYQDSTEQLKSLTKSRDDEIKKLADYQDQYSTLTDKVNGYNDALKKVVDNIKYLKDNREALTDPMTVFWDQMEKNGITKDAVKAQEAKVPEDYAKGIADINAQSKTTMDFLQSYWEKLSQTLGTYLSPLEPVATGVGIVSGAITGLAGLKLLAGGGLGSLLGGGAAAGGIAGGLGGASTGGTGVAAAATATVEAGMGSAMIAAGIGVATLAAVIVGGILLGLAGVAALVYSGALDWVKSIGDTFKDKLPGALDMPSIVLAPLGALGIAAVDLVTGKLDRIPEDVGKIFLQAWQAAGRQLSGLKTAMDDAWDVITDWGGDTLKSITGVWDDIKSGIPPSWSGITSAISGEVNTLITDFTSWVGGLSTAVSSIWTGILNAVPTSWAPISAAVGIAVGGIVTWIASQPTAFVTAAGLIWSEILAAIPGAWAPIGTAVSASVDGIRTWIGTQINPFTDEMGKIWANISTMIPPDWGTIKAAVITAVDDVRTWIGAQAQPFVDTMGNIWIGIQNGVSGAWAGIRNAITAAIGVLAAAMDIALAPIRTYLGIINGVGSAVQGALALLPGGTQTPAATTTTTPYTGTVVSQTSQSGGGYAADAMSAPIESNYPDYAAWYEDYQKWKATGSYHTGGTYQAPGGASEGLALLLSGERVLSPSQTNDYDSGLLDAVKQLSSLIKSMGSGGSGKDISVTIQSDIPATVKKIDQYNKQQAYQAGYR